MRATAIAAKKAFPAPGNATRRTVRCIETHAPSASQVSDPPSFPPFRNFTSLSLLPIHGVAFQEDLAIRHGTNGIHGIAEVGDIKNDEGPLPLPLPLPSLTRADLVMMEKEATSSDDLNQVISGYLSLNDVSRANGILSKMEENFGLSKSLLPTSCSYILVLNAWASRCTISGAPQRAQAVLEKMERLHREGAIAVPAVEHYNAVIRAWGESGEHMSASRAQEVFDRMELRVRNRSSISSMIRSWSGAGDRRGAASAVLPSIESDRVSYSLLVDAWSRSKLRDAPFRANELLKQMLKMSEDDEMTHMEPTLEEYICVLTAWKRASARDVPGAPSRAHHLLSLMENLYKNKTISVRPDEECFRIVLESLAMCTAETYDAPNEAETLLLRMEDSMLDPKTHHFAAVIYALTNSPEKDAPERADALLQRMEEHFRIGRDGPPTIQNYAHVISIWKNSERKEAAAQIDSLFARIQLLQTNTDVHLSLTSSMIHDAIDSQSFSNHKHKADKAQSLLRNLLQLHAKGNPDAVPTAAVYNSVIRVCLRTHGNESIKGNALRIAINTVRDLKKLPGVDPLTCTYKLLLKSCNALLMSDDKQRNRALQMVFQRCCQDGLVDEGFIMEFGNSVSLDTYRKVFKRQMDVYDPMKSLPKHWSRNVPVVASDAKAFVDEFGRLMISKQERDKRIRGLGTKQKQKMLRGGRLTDEEMMEMKRTRATSGPQEIS